MTDQELVDYYTNLLVIQYKTMPNAVGTISALATEVVASQIYSQVMNGFDLQTAIGEQLDILASYVGAPRTIFAYDPSILYFALPSYATSPSAAIGFALYADITDPADDWLLYTTSPTTYVLTDGQLRLLIAYLIAVHKSDHTLAAIDLILKAFFTTYATLIDHEDMSITYEHQLADPNLLYSIVKQIGRLPHPAGVEVITTEV